MYIFSCRIRLIGVHLHCKCSIVQKRRKQKLRRNTTRTKLRSDRKRNKVAAFLELSHIYKEVRPACIIKAHDQTEIHRDQVVDARRLEGLNHFHNSQSRRSIRLRSHCRQNCAVDPRNARGRRNVEGSARQAL